MTKTNTAVSSIESGNNIIDAVPRVLADRALLCARERGVPVEIPLLVGLSAVATAIGKGLVVRSGRERFTRGNLFILIGTASGIGKSEVFRDIFEPVLDFDAELSSWWQEAPVVRARAGEELLKAQITGLRSTIRKFPDANMLIYERLQKAAHMREVCTHYYDASSLLADDATSEALGDLMGRSNETISTVSADARYQLKRLSVADSKEESFYLKGFSGDLTLSSRITRKAVKLRAPCLSALFLTQRDAYRAFIRKAEMNRSGLLPRFLHCETKAAMTDDIPFDLRRATTSRSNFAERIRQLVEAFRFETSPAVALPTKATRALMQQIECDSKQSALQDESICGEILRRRAEQIWRVALCLHAVEHGAKATLKPLELKTAQCAQLIVECCHGQT
jgi:hypothetical protein